MPSWLQGFVRWSPFTYELFFPVQVYMERMPVERMLQGLAIQAGWVMIIWAVARRDVARGRATISGGGRLMRRYLEIYWLMIRNSLIREMSFKANFILWIFVELLWFVGQMVFIQVIFQYVDAIGDWSKWEVVLLVGTHQLIGQIYHAFFYVNVANLPELVRTGRLDLMLLLPVDAQFAVSTRQFGLDQPAGSRDPPSPASLPSAALP